MNSEEDPGRKPESCGRVKGRKRQSHRIPYGTGHEGDERKSKPVTGERDDP